MNELLRNVLTASFHGSIVIAVVIVLRLVLKRTPKKFICLLWLLAGVRLLMPFEIQSSLSLQPEPAYVVERQWRQLEQITPPVSDSEVEDRMVSALPVDDSPAFSGGNTPATVGIDMADVPASTAAPTVSGNRNEQGGRPAIDWPALAFYLWLGVAVCFALSSIYSYLRLKYRVREAVKIPGGWECDRIETAFILGFIKPQIYIPMGMSSSNREYILAHERTHLEKGDHWFKMIGYVALAIHWFNPLVWVAYILLCKDIEMACDERVVQFMEVEERKRYSAALLNCSTNRAHFAACPVAFGEVSVKNRIKTVLNYRKPSFWISLAGVVAIIFVAVCLVTSPVDNGEAPVSGETTAGMTEEQKALQVCADALDAVLAQDPYHLTAIGNDEQGHMVWTADLYKLDGNTMWIYHPSSSPDPTDGRMEYGGTHYAYQSGKWVKTDAADTRFADWLDSFRWNMETAAFSERLETEYGTQTAFTVRWQNDDAAVHTATVTYTYDLTGNLSNIRVKNANNDAAQDVLLFLDDADLVDQTVQQSFAKAAANIMTGEVTAEELAVQEEYAAWGVLFRVDDDRLSSVGSDVYISQDVTGMGVLNTTEAYWIERRNGDTWEMVEPISTPQWGEGTTGIPKGTTTYEYLDWSAVYGKLPTGYYRIGKTVSCYDKATKYQKNRAFYSEFEIIEQVNSDSPEAAAAVERCYAAVEEVKARDHIHYKTNTSWQEETWWHNGNYMFIRTFPEDAWDEENRGRVDIYAFWNGGGYMQVREDPAVRNSEVIGMKLSTLLDNRGEWIVSFAEEDSLLWFERSNQQITFPEGIGVISDEMVRFCGTWTANGLENNTPDVQLTYRFDEDGRLTYMEYKTLYDEQPLVYYIEIYDTSAEQIDAQIEPYTQNLIVGEFSWEEARTKYTGGAFSIRENSFVNTDTAAISSPLEVARRAIREYPDLGEYLSMDVSHDETAGMWKVTIESYYEYQASYEYRDVYMDENGVTKLLVYEGPVEWQDTRK